MIHLGYGQTRSLLKLLRTQLEHTVDTFLEQGWRKKELKVGHYVNFEKIGVSSINLVTIYYQFPTPFGQNI